MKHSKKRGYVAASIIGLAILVALPLAAVASNRFTDVPDSNVFHGDIGWLADAAITLGCNPPANDEFCPSDGVTRQQMAAFMRRFAQYLGAEDGTPAEVDNADTVDGLHAGDLTARWALVAADGTIVDQSGGISMTSSFDGGYYINFGSSVEGHVVLATIKYRNSAPSNSDGTLVLSPCATLGTTCVVAGTNTTSHVWVLTRDGSGTQDGRPFYVAVLP